MKVHFCPLDSDCRRTGAPPRLHVFTARHTFTLALTPNARWTKAADNQGNRPFTTHWIELRKNSDIYLPLSRREAEELAALLRGDELMISKMRLMIARRLEGELDD